MRDPHVVSLHYRLVSAESVAFSKQARPVEAEADGFRVRLADEALEVEMLDHHGSEQSAREAVEPYLRAWEICHALRVGGQPEVRFEFQRAEVVDRDPPPPGTPQTVELSGVVHGRSRNWSRTFRSARTWRPEGRERRTVVSLSGCLRTTPYGPF